MTAGNGVGANFNFIQNQFGADQANPFQPTAGANSNLIGQPGSTNRGLCSLSFGGKVFTFRTNPNSVGWSYELITHAEETYGGRVVQILGTRLGDLTVKVECGLGGWPYLMQVVGFLRDMMSDQRGDATGTFEYTTRGWKLKVYALSLPFEDEVGATTRELTLQFKIQEDVSGIISSSTLSAELARLQDGVYRPDQVIKNKYTDGSVNAAGGTSALDGSTNPGVQGSNSPAGYAGQGTANTVDSSPLGDNPGGTNPFASFLPSIPGLSAIFGGL